MGKREQLLKQISEEVYTSSGNIPKRLSKEEIEAAGLLNEVENIYHSLGGVLKEIPLKYGKYDITLEGLYIELDEERHFNRYRLKTLSSSIYANHPFFSVKNYKEYCVAKEVQCLKAAGFGKNWKTPSTEKQFVPSNTEKDISGNGSSRWRQRAFYDFLKDVTYTIRKIPVVRISIYDKYNEITIGEMLKSQDTQNLSQYLEYIKHLLQEEGVLHK